MNPSQLAGKQRKMYIIGAIVAVFVLMVLIVLPIIQRSINGPTSQDYDTYVDQAEPDVPFTPPTISITNFDEHVENLPTEKRTEIEMFLYGAIDQNISDQDLSDITAQIRNGSYRQAYDPNTQIYSTEFIVDILDIRQSYLVTDQFSIWPPDITGLWDDVTFVLCLDAKDLIFGEFNCTDRFTIGAGGV